MSTLSAPSQTAPTAARPAQAGLPGAKVRRFRMPFIVILVGLTLLIPIRFDIGPLALSGSRALFLILVPVLGAMLLAGKFGKLQVIDFLVVGQVIWMGLAIAKNNPSSTVTFVGSQAVVVLGGYLVGRAFVRNRQNYIGLMLLMGLFLVLTLPLNLYETRTSVTLFPDLISMIPGVRPYGDINHDPRMGLWRVQGSFVHPIHFGLFCTMIFSPVFIGMRYSLPATLRFTFAGVAAFSCFLSLSSGPLLALMCQIALIGWFMVMRKTGSPWKWLGLLAAAGYLVLEIMSTQPVIYALATAVAFNSWNAFIRQVLLEYGLAQVWRTPLLGIGYNPLPLPYYMTGSVDNFWLLLAVVYGVPGFAFLFGGIVWVMIQAGRRDMTHDLELAALRRAWIIAMVALMITLGTVAIWAELHSIVMLIIGAGVWLLDTPINAPGGGERTVSTSAQIAADARKTVLSRAPSAPVRLGPEPQTNRPKPDAPAPRPATITARSAETPKPEPERPKRSGPTRPHALPPRRSSPAGAAVNRPAEPPRTPAPDPGPKTPARSPAPAAPATTRKTRGSEGAAQYSRFATKHSRPKNGPNK